jgi:hypothetical protein
MYFTPRTSGIMADKSEPAILMKSLREGYLQLFMHVETGKLFIFYPINFSTSVSYDERVLHHVAYELLGENNHFTRMFAEGNPYVEGFEYIGEYAHYQDCRA